MDAQYLNSTVAAPLAEALELVAKFQPADPVHALATFLLKKADELERGKQLATVSASATRMR